MTWSPLLKVLVKIKPSFMKMRSKVPSWVALEVALMAPTRTGWSGFDTSNSQMLDGMENAVPPTVAANATSGPPDAWRGQLSPERTCVRQRLTGDDFNPVASITRP